MRKLNYVSTKYNRSSVFALFGLMVDLSPQEYVNFQKKWLSKMSGLRPLAFVFYCLLQRCQSYAHFIYPQKHLCLMGHRLSQFETAIQYFMNPDKAGQVF